MKFKKTFYLIASLLLFTNTSFAQVGVEEYGIAIIPQDLCVQRARSLNKEIAKNLPKLPNPQNKWHVTLFQGAFTVEDIQKIKSEIVKLNVKKFEIEFEDLKDTRDKWIDWNIDNTRYLQKLHEKIVAIASPLYKRPIIRAEGFYDLLSKKEEEQIDQYGVQGVMDLYRPHMSLFYTHPADKALRKIAKIIDEEKYEDVKCMAEKIVIGKLGYDGNMTRVVETIDLKKSKK